MNGRGETGQVATLAIGATPSVFGGILKAN